MAELRDHHFKCPACDEEGIIGLPDVFQQFNCPTECGASFVKYQGQAGWAIHCVVEPKLAHADETRK